MHAASESVISIYRSTMFANTVQSAIKTRRLDTPILISGLSSIREAPADAFIANGRQPSITRQWCGCAYPAGASARWMARMASMRARMNSVLLSPSR